MTKITENQKGDIKERFSDIFDQAAHFNYSEGISIPGSNFKDIIERLIAAVEVSLEEMA